MREAWCVFTEIIENRKSDSRCTSCVIRIRFRLAYSPLWERSTRITRAYHDVILWILPGTPKILACDPGTTTCWPICTLHSLLLLFVLLLWWLIFSDVIDDRYLEKLINLVEEHPALYNTLLKEYKDSIISGNIWDSIAEAIDGCGNVDI